MTRKRVYSENSTLKSSTRINCQLFVFILDASNVVNLYTLKYVALQDINCGVREAVSLKGDTQKGLWTENSNCGQLFVYRSWNNISSMLSIVI